MSESSTTIWLINHYAGNQARGMEYRHQFLASELKKHGFRPVILASSFHHLFSDPPHCKKTVTFDSDGGIDFVWLRCPRYAGNGAARLCNCAAFSWQLNKRATQIAREVGFPALVMASTPHPFVVMNLRKLKRRLKIPVVFEVRDLWPQMLFELGSLSKRNPLAWLFSWLERWGYRNADLVISLWFAADQYMFQHGLDPDRYMFLPNGVSLGAEESSRANSHSLLTRVAEQKVDGKFIVGYAGSHGYANPLDCIVDSANLLQQQDEKRIEFFLVGDGPEKARIRDRVHELGLENVLFEDYVDRATILEFLKEVDVGYIGLKDLPLFKYGPTPNKLMDYMLQRLPIIYGIHSPYQPVRDAGAGICIEPSSAQELTEAVIELSRKPKEELREMGERGRRFAEEHLTYEVLGERLARRLRDLLP